jgi:hypothetical protein
MTMTLDELRDAHAKRDDRFKHWPHLRFLDQIGAHPVPATLDAIAGLMPPGWWWTREGGSTPNPNGLLLKWAACQVGHDRWGVVTTPDTGDELTDRARLAWLAWEAEAKGGK